MTIEYKDSRRISALTADTKPTNVEDNSILVEKDTVRRYWFSEALAPTFEDDFTSDNWTDSDSSIIGVGTNVLDFQEKDGNFNETSYISQTIGDIFVYRMKFNLSTIDQTGNVESVRTTFALSNADDVAFTTARDEVGITMRVSSTYNKFYAFTADGAQIPYGGTDFSFTPATSTDYYLEIIGNEGTYTFNIYSDEYSTLIESESITDAGLVLDKLVVRTATSATTNNQARGTIDGVTTPTPATWTMQPTWRDDFSTDDWVDTGSNIEVNTSTDVIDWDALKTATNSQTAYDLGAGIVSDTNWVLRYDVTVDTRTNTSSSSNVLWTGLFDGASTVDSETAQDHLGMDIIGSTTQALSKFSLTHADGIGLASAGVDNILTNIDTGTWYVELIRESATLLKGNIYSDSTYTTLLASGTRTIVSTVTGLRYIKFVRRNSSASGGTYNGTIDNVKFYNGVTSIN